MTSPLSFLLLEDNAIIAMALQMDLEDLGHRAAVAATVADAVELCRSQTWDLCVIDVNLPGDHDGFDAVPLLREHCQAPLVFVTGYDDEETRARAHACGSVAFLVKPVRAGQILAAIAEDGPKQ